MGLKRAIEHDSRPTKKQRQKEIHFSSESPITDNDEATSVCSEHNPIVLCSSKRTLEIEYWSRSDECKEAKWNHLDEISHRETHILSTTLANQETVMEPNMFPYDTPDDIEHWTLWSIHELSMEQVCNFVDDWIEREKPTQVVAWNYDENESRSIDIFHVHVYLQFTTA